METITLLTPNAEDADGDYWDPWDALGLPCCSYNSEIDEQAIAVLQGIADKMFNTDIAEKTGMSPAHVELWQGIFCSRDWCEYGTSPRGCFPNYGSEFEDIGRIIASWKAYYQRHWNEAYPDSPTERT